MASYGESVFINCPFDPMYEGLFKAIIFTVLDCGYTPRSTKEIENFHDPRIHTIYRIISECRYGIHDLSRTQLDQFGLPRFNMPLELGIFLSAQYFGSHKQKMKESLVMAKTRYRYQIYMSDLAGQDVKAHQNQISKVIEITRNWLRTKTNEIIPSPSSIWSHYKLFKRALPIFCETMPIRLDSKALHHKDYLAVAAEWLRINT
ncbi:MAG: hypothetical protein WEA61_07420 [Anaerolineales bacterium]